MISTDAKNELRQAASSVVAWLQEYGHPHMAVTITQSGLEVTEALLGIPADSSEGLGFERADEVQAETLVESFNAGDKVVCIDSRDAEDFLTCGAEYEVHEVNGEYVSLTNMASCSFWFSWRFRKGILPTEREL